MAQGQIALHLLTDMNGTLLAHLNTREAFRALLQGTGKMPCSRSSSCKAWGMHFQRRRKQCSRQHGKGNSPPEPLMHYCHVSCQQAQPGIRLHGRTVKGSLIKGRLRIFSGVSQDPRHGGLGGGDGGGGEAGGTGGEGEGGKGGLGGGLQSKR